MAKDAKTKTGPKKPNKAEIVASKAKKVDKLAAGEVVKK